MEHASVWNGQSLNCVRTTHHTKLVSTLSPPPVDPDPRLGGNRTHADRSALRVAHRPPYLRVYVYASFHTRAPHGFLRRAKPAFRRAPALAFSTTTSFPGRAQRLTLSPFLFPRNLTVNNGGKQRARRAHTMNIQQAQG